MKVVENSPQNARNCTILFLTNYLVEGMPQKPLRNGSQHRCSRHAASRHVRLYPKSPKVAPSPLRNPACASALSIRLYAYYYVSIYYLIVQIVLQLISLMILQLHVLM